MNLIGWVGTICLALCGVPQAVACWRQGHARGLNTAMLILWFVGEVCYLVATVGEFGCVPWLLTNYGMNLLCLATILFYKWRS